MWHKMPSHSLYIFLYAMNWLLIETDQTYLVTWIFDMEVTIHSNVTGAIGVVVVSTDPDQTIGSLIRAFCIEKGISRQSEFVLTNCRQEILQRNRKLVSYGIQNGEELYLSLNGKYVNQSYCYKWNDMFNLSVLEAIGFFI
jgi:hypothetical protein